MNGDLSGYLLRFPACPDELHKQSRRHEDDIRDPDRNVNIFLLQDGNGNAALGFRFEAHVDDHVGQYESGDGIPRPRLDPPGRYDEEDGALDAPRVASVGDYQHRGVHGIALHVDDVDDPHEFRGECVVPRRNTEVTRDPEQIED